MVPAPKIDHRSRDHVYCELKIAMKELLRIDVNKDPKANALLQIFSRFNEHLIYRLNRVPDKIFLAYLDRLNVIRRPPLSASAPLTFTPLSKLPASQRSIIVPAGTKVAAAPAEGESEPSVFETRHDLYVTDWQLHSILVVDAQADRYENLSHLADPATVSDGRFPFHAGQSIAHEFYIAHAPILSQANIAELRIDVDIHRDFSLPPGNRLITWFAMSSDGEIELIPTTDTTAQLRTSGVIVFRNLPQLSLNVLGGNLDHWLGCRLRSALPAPDHKSSASPRLSAIDNLILTATWATAQTELAAALFNTTPVDISKDFFPFGPNPQFGDVFYLSCSAWDRPGAEVTLDIKLTNPASGGATLPIPPVNNTGKPDIRWEYWSGDKWTRLSAHDGTQNLTESGSVSFQIPDSLGASSVHGVNGHWVRARMACGNYGHTLQSADDGAVSPPSIESMKVSVSHFIGPVKPEKIVTHNNLMFDVVDKKAAFIPFCAQQKNDKAIYFGFTAPREDARNACRKALDLYFHIGGSQKRLIYRIGGATRLPVLNWEYFNGDGWQTAQVEDDTDALTMSGMVRIAVAGPMGALNRSVAPPGLYWVRAVWRNGDYGCRPLLRRVMMNTVPVDHAMTLANEILGSSNGLPQQTFRSARAPLLNCIRLDVIEPEMPSESELRAIRHLEGHDAVRIVDDAQGRPKQIWVRWHQANDFLKSKNRDRHFSVDHQTGKICFGDGIKGMIPPAGSNNVRLARYRTGGGETGNKPIDSITQLRSSLAFIASCTNTEPATGGQAFETWDALKKRGAAGLRHRHRAVTLEDFEDLAVLASPAVARAKCYPNRDLATDQDAQLEMPGVASLIVIPHGTDRKPAPNPGLLRRVGEYIDCHKPADTELVILGPEYVGVKIEMVIVPHAGESGTLLASRCQQAIQRLLHPINGGAVGQGWSFGSLPNDSDILGFCDNIDGLDRVGHLHIRFIEDRPGLLKSGLFLAAAGHLDVLAEF